MDKEAFELKRFWHWGPLLTAALNVSVNCTTLLWWPTDLSLKTHAYFGLFLLLNLLTAYNFIMSVLVGPGVLPKQWQPEHGNDTKFLQFCQKCDGYKAPRSHHCLRCDRCVKKMDHHCPWINNCVGWANHAYFTYFLFFYMLSNLQSAVVLAQSGSAYFIRNCLVRRRCHNLINLAICLMSFGMAVGVVLCMLKLLHIQLRCILSNKTTIEQWIVEKAANRRGCRKRKLEPFVFPYNLGWYFNLGQVFNVEAQSRGSGIEWPVRDGCDQYTLSREQLAQKQEKRERSRIYRCIRRATGHWLPIFSQGIKVTACVPCADDARIRVELNDLIRVTRTRDHWLFGELVRSERGEPHELRQGCIRGWFPRRCAVDVTETI
ncbi:hypothetical protein KR093_009915, partial [Drosophila rubida]